MVCLKKIAYYVITSRPEIKGCNGTISYKQLYFHIIMCLLMYQANIHGFKHSAINFHS